MTKILQALLAAYQRGAENVTSSKLQTLVKLGILICDEAGKQRRSQETREHVSLSEECDFWRTWLETTRKLLAEEGECQFMDNMDKLRRRYEAYRANHIRPEFENRRAALETREEAIKIEKFAKGLRYT